jgi:putative pyruvate formate lyase activating enzyme
MAGLIDIYMPDFKLWSPQACGRYLAAGDYAERARQAIAQMHRQVGDLRYAPDGTACRGLLVRHLVMPGMLEESARIFEWLAGLSRDMFVNVMGQYRPANRVGEAAGGDQDRRTPQFAEIDRRPGRAEIALAYDLARRAGLWRFDEASAV